MKCIVTFRLRDGVSHEEYEQWFRRENVPAVRKMRSISSYRVWRLAGVMDGSPGFEYLEEMEITGRAPFEQELERLPEMAAMLEGWYGRVRDQVVVYMDEVSQE